MEHYGVVFKTLGYLGTYLLEFIDIKLVPQQLLPKASVIFNTILYLTLKINKFILEFHDVIYNKIFSFLLDFSKMDKFFFNLDPLAISCKFFLIVHFIIFGKN